MTPLFNIISKSYTWILASIILIVVAAFLFFSNLRLSIQFTWWMEITIDTQIEDEWATTDWITQVLENEWFESPWVWIWSRQWYPSILLEIDIEDDEQVDNVSRLVRSYLHDNWYISDDGDILETSIIWPSIWDWMKRSAILAIVFWLIFIVIYMLFAFSWIRDYLSPWVLALITMFTLLFDIIIPAWAYWLFMFFNHAIQVDLIFIVALLTIMGYSINDTIIIFDRIRENIWLNKNKLIEWSVDFQQVFEKSVWQTMRRSLATSFSTLIVLISMYIFWWWIIQLFAFTLMIWVVAGTFSSIFLAAPLAYKFAINNNVKELELDKNK